MLVIGEATAATLGVVFLCLVAGFAIFAWWIGDDLPPGALD